ncbi:MAG: glutathione S-transferase family protein [Roseibium sp.]|uniref:glutathione S-transferase family protein n=1 Tax=Roseibium sp. TaxID=1936156 RepID=UPI001B1A9381|nr:glutathione S-transferase family protein [Roseibium sp.]MBO6890900.1 glutathione S-transferase family protein [Roseibium sp.]MBO6929747.1 glutathione S-transferase family protein [Roseibium sp.]
MKDVKGREQAEMAPGRYRLYGSPDSANFVVRMVLEELGEAYDYVPVDRHTSQQKSAEYRRLNPQGLIPVLEAPGQEAPLFETAGILLYLCDRHAALAPGVSDSARGRFLKWLFFVSNTLHSDLRIFFKPHRYLPGDACRQQFNEALLKRITGGFEHLESELESNGHPFLLGEQLSCVDIYIAACARWAQIYGTGDNWSPDETPCLANLLTLLQKRPAVLKACELEQISGPAFMKPLPMTLPGITA